MKTLLEKGKKRLAPKPEVNEVHSHKGNTIDGWLTSHRR